MSNPTIEILRSRRSVRRYKPDQPSDEVIETIVRAGQQAPFTS
jgi:nitroreductase